MTGFALDYSTGRPDAARVVAAGYVGVIRYVGFNPADRPKCITQAEYDDMLGHGVGVALVYEDHVGDVLGGRPAGQQAARRARAWADRIGFPTGRPIYMACDTDIVLAEQFLAVMDYLRGAGDVLGGASRVGVYGEHDVVERARAAGVADWLWQTKAWSVGKVSGHAHLLQLIGTVVVDGVGCDRNTILAADWGQAGAAETAPETSPAWRDRDMFIVRRTDGIALLVGRYGVSPISSTGLAVLTKVGVPVTEGLSNADVTAICEAIGVPTFGDPVLAAAGQLLGAVGAGQRTFEGTVEAILGTVQSLVTISRGGQTALAAQIRDEATAVLTAVAAHDTAGFTDAQAAQAAQAISAKVAEHGIAVDGDALMDALATRLAA